MAPVSAILRRLGIRINRYLNELFIHYCSGVAISTAFHCNWSITSVLNAAGWRSSSVFTSFHLTYSFFFFLINGLQSFGPFYSCWRASGLALTSSWLVRRGRSGYKFVHQLLWDLWYSLVYGRLPRVTLEY